MTGIEPAWPAWKFGPGTSGLTCASVGPGHGFEVSVSDRDRPRGTPAYGHVCGTRGALLSASLRLGPSCRGTAVFLARLVVRGVLARARPSRTSDSAPESASMRRWSRGWELGCSGCRPQVIVMVWSSVACGTGASRGGEAARLDPGAAVRTC
jgi:hypothetical protein